MAFYEPYQQHIFMGYFANDAAALAEIQANEWDTGKDGTGNPEPAMMYYNTTSSTMLVYNGTAWVDLGITDHGALDGKDDDDHTQYALLAGRSGGQTLYGGTDSGDNLVLYSTSDATKGQIDLMDEIDANSNKIVGLATPTDATDAATKGYVDQLIQGAEWQDSVLDKDASTPPGGDSAGDRYIVAAAGNANITAVTQGTKTFELAGDQSSTVTASDILRIKGSTGNDGWYTVVSSTFDDPNTSVVVSEAIPDATVDGAGYWAGATWDTAGVDRIVEYNGATWDTTEVEEGFAAWVDDEDTAYVFNGTNWVKMSSAVNHNDLSGLQGGQASQYYHLTSAEHTEITTFFANTDMTGAEAETLTDGSDASTLHIHDARYYTETEIGGTTGGSEGASLVGTDSKTRLNAATDVETALTEIDSTFVKRFTGAARNPNGSVTPTMIGDIYVSTTSPYRRYMAVGLTNADWTVI
jgi:hypothetical protein